MRHAISFLLLAILTLVHAAVVPLNLDGALEAAVADSTDFNTGGTITVNGVAVKIPRNLQFQFPAAFVPFKTVAAGGFLGNEVSVTGNLVDGVPIAGLVSIAEFGLFMNTGVVMSVAFDGAIKMDTGATFRINDPNAVYSAGYTGARAFTADDENPSVTAYSGFPMCVPRSANDAECPSSNRPQWQRSFLAPDSTVMAPIQPGDCIECSGVRRNGETICYNVVVPNVQILTTGVPPYIRMEDAIIGVVDDSSINNVEFADSRFIGLTSDSSVSLTISRTVVDPCTGEVKYESVGAAQPRAPRNKFTWRPDATVKSAYTRDYHITASGGTRETNGGQILAGQYVQPVGEWIFPESTEPGDIPPKADFSSFTWLAQGSGPDEDNNIWGPLSPWPDSQAPPAPPACAPLPPDSPGSGTTPDVSGSDATPTVEAGTDQAVRPGTRVELKAVVSNAASFPANSLKYSWTADPQLTISNPTAATVSFTAPNVVALTSYTVMVNVTSGTTSATDSVTVRVDPSRPDEVFIDSYNWNNRQGGTISVTAHSNVVDGNARLSLILNNPNAGTPIPMVSSGGGRFTYTARSTKNPTNGITVRSNLRGTASSTRLTARKGRRSQCMLD
ncbi:hypothetical protein TI39_contig4207g00003 [Zymoseptoria brevis]|uniref:Uncharacterized protein n=1 Tax=Zymoseptoria brevis TaxID=1047168 RepID=A0A0F4GDE9_9PEZI|nr:hypothetical protein TI39_contig4207g00003 [Zymoseptoria brevis]